MIPEEANKSNEIFKKQQKISKIIKHLEKSNKRKFDKLADFERYRIENARREDQIQGASQKELSK